MSILTKIFSGGIDKLVGTVGGIVDDLTLSKEEKEKLKIDMFNAVNSHEEKMAGLAQAETDAYLKDVDSARQMQIEALKQGDTFSKRFIYYLAAGLIFLTFGYDMLFFFIKYPPENRDMINMVAGVLNSTALATIVSFFFGSSKGSKDAGERMDSMMKQVVSKA